MTRKKDNAQYEIVVEFDCSHSRDIESDQVILLRYRENSVSRTVEVRLISYIDPESSERL
ncbi:hypothetical protein MMU07_14585 [Aquiflexum sp. LQ15W]|uniref:hypothetical protein n=1 Tax=Cognataquiflexum nitidum TaxID=2922272 RepID=UPI001F148A5D|nr:hypothetical protein [Cognataquiflexum nitidum]MCH6200809.1 hypothetical protein [Cognataquiflexum nitidum]